MTNVTTIQRRPRPDFISIQVLSMPSQEKSSTITSPYNLDLAELHWQEGDTPSANRYDDIYFSKQQGLLETEYVFLQHNQLQQRWQQLTDNPAEHTAHCQHSFTIAETGFGTGLNFLAAWRLWRQTAPANAQLNFISVEKHPLQLNDLQRALTAWPELADFANQLIAAYPVLIPGHHLLTFDHGRVQLHLLLGDGIDCLEQLRESDHPELAIAAKHRVDAWFLDGFAPAKNPSLWNNDLYQLMAQLSTSGTTVSTFTAVGAVRRGLEQQGFAIKKTAGFGRKRDMLCGVFNCHPPQPQVTIKGVKAPWYFSNQRFSGNHAVVIGGGLAGTNSAYALAQRGWRVTLIERRQQLAQGASGNPQGMLYTKLSPQPGQLNHFTLTSYLYALRIYRQLVDGQLLAAKDHDFCGVLQLATTAKDRRLFSQLKQAFAGHSELVEFADAERASNIAGISLDHQGWFFPQSGWVSPQAICKALVLHPDINVHCNSEALRLTRRGQQWYVEDSASLLAQADAVIIANSRDAVQFDQTAGLPLKTIRGQITQLPASKTLSTLKTVICHEGYITPEINGQNILGATFDNNDCDTGLRAVDHQRNLQSLQRAVPSTVAAIEQQQIETLQGRASLRCTSPDYLPLVGPVPDQQQFHRDYSMLRANAHSNLTNTGSYYPGLYLNVGHGSRGLTSTPLCGQLLAATISQGPIPLPRGLNMALNPARFTIRDLIRNRV